MNIRSCFVTVIGLMCLTSATANPSPQIIEKLEEIIEIQEHIHKEQLVLAELGQADATEIVRTANALTEARIALAREKGDREGELEGLESLIANYRNLFVREKARVEDGRAPHSALGELRLELLRAEIRLLRLKREMPEVEN